MNTPSVIAIIALMGIAFAAGWVMNEKHNNDRDKDEDIEPTNSEEDQTHNPFVQ